MLHHFEGKFNIAKMLDMFDSVRWRDVASLVGEEQEANWASYIGESYKDSFFNDKLSRALGQANISFVASLGEKISVKFQDYDDQVGDMTACRDFFIDHFDDIKSVCKVWTALTNHEMGRGGSHPDDVYKLLSQEA